MERNTGYPDRMTIRHIPHSCNDESGDLQNYKPNLVNHLSKNYLDDSCHFFSQPQNEYEQFMKILFNDPESKNNGIANMTWPIGNYTSL